MNEEEKRSVNIIKSIQKQFYENKQETNLTCYDDMIIAIDIVLNLITKLQKENETTIKLNANMSKRHLNDIFKIKKLQKENEKLKAKLLDTLEGQKVIIEETPQDIKENYISKEEVKDKIEEYKNMLKTCNKVKDIDRIKAINERILELQELLEGRK